MRFGLVLAAAFSAYGQSPTFEVASIKPYQRPEGQTMQRVGCSGGPGTKDPVRWSCENMSVHNLIVTAYDIRSYQVSGLGPFDGERYNLNAKVPEGATREQFRQMLQNLLAERFGLKIHREQKEMSTYELVVAKNGPKLKDAAPEPPKDSAAEEPRPVGPPRFAMGKDGFPEMPPGSTGMMIMNGRASRRGARDTMTALAMMLSSQVGRPVIDATGLTGTYETVLNWSMSSGPTPPPPPGAEGAIPAAAEPSGPTIFAALQEQLGLKLEPKKGMVEILVVDKVEKTPTEN
jgi:uncharacterized protein (TIGR03435 family)